MSTYFIWAGVIVHLWVLCGLVAWGLSIYQRGSLAKDDFHVLPLVLSLGPFNFLPGMRM